MPKLLSMAGMAVSALVFLAFLLDIVLGIPFGGASSMMSIGLMIASGILGYLSWSAWRDVA